MCAIWRENRAVAHAEREQRRIFETRPDAKKLADFIYLV
jgi:hypothetical protein